MLLAAGDLLALLRTQFHQIRATLRLSHKVELIVSVSVLVAETSGGVLALFAFVLAIAGGGSGQFAPSKNSCDMSCAKR